MTELPVAPGHRDIARGLCCVLACYRNEVDTASIWADNIHSAEDAGRFTGSIITAFATFMHRKLGDETEAYLLAWIAVELELADLAEGGPPQE